jgi:hypothetical protein
VNGVSGGTDRNRPPSRRTSLVLKFGIRVLMPTVTEIFIIGLLWLGRW